MFNTGTVWIKMNDRCQSFLHRILLQHFKLNVQTSPAFIKREQTLTRPTKAPSIIPTSHAVFELLVTHYMSIAGCMHMGWSTGKCCDNMSNENKTVKT